LPRFPNDDDRLAPESNKPIMYLLILYLFDFNKCVVYNVTYEDSSNDSKS